ncbi:MAG: Na+/H+ antiporter subunit B [Desulfobacteraceae bacterium]|nr:Na+/H+ antiporter subunit B [Desulfobacteraceae bacterium]
MKSIILSTSSRYLLPLLLMLSIYLLVYGHNVPGGGFVGGLVASAAFALYSIANGVKEAIKILYFNPMNLAGTGLLLVLISGCIGIFAGKPFLTALWSDYPLPVIGKAGTPLLFDTGVYLVVIGVSLTILFSLEED